MKKSIILSCLMCMMAIGAKAQLEVDSVGKVTIGADYDGAYPLYIKVKDHKLGPCIEGGRRTLFIKNNQPLNSHTGLYVTSVPGSGSVGIQVNNTVDENTSTGATIGIKSIIGGTHAGHYSIAGGLSYTTGNNNITQKGVAVFGSSNQTISVPSQYKGIYAGFFYGDVRVTGTLYATMLTPTENSTSAVASLNTERGVMQSNGIADGVSDRLSQVSLLQFHREQEVESSENKKTITKKDTDLLLAEEDIYEEDEVETDEAVPQTQLATVQYGLAADQLREVYPELVYEDQNGNVSINYIEMIPLLVQANNELRARVLALEKAQGKTEQKTKGFVEATEEQVPSLQGRDEEGITLLLSLGQNDPNPFSEQTSIEVSVPESVTSATLLIFDMQGKQVKRIDISDRGTSRITVMGQGLPEGMYLYSLVADGKVVKTRKMILSK